MRSSRTESPRRWSGRRWALVTGLALSSLLPSIGCQAEYAGMTLPTGKYMHDDVQYFGQGLDFPWAKTQAATQRARMQAMGMDPDAKPASASAPVPPAAPANTPPPPPAPGAAKPAAPAAAKPAAPKPADDGDDVAVPMPK